MPRAFQRLAATTVIRTGDHPVGLRFRRLAVEVVAGPDAGASAEMEGRTLTIGTADTATLRLSDPTVSRFHCRLTADGEGYRLLDRGSANGTLLGNARLREIYLDGPVDLILGDTTIRISIGTDEREISLSAEEAFGGAVGRSIAMRELFATARRAATTNATVLLLGETGTGKDVLARAIHDHSPRARAPYVVFDCSAVAPSLIEAQLFGQVRGAFTGAEQDRPGIFELADGGTVFLDEIGELSLTLQPKLLRALETSKVTRLGSATPTSVDVRIVAATNRDLRADVEAGAFRADLYYRLAVIPLEVPALRDRPEDIPLLAAHFLRHILSSDGADLSWLRPHLDEAFGSLVRHRWPGNVRELRNVIDRAAALADPRALLGDGFARLVEVKRSLGTSLTQRPPLATAREQFDREYLREVLEAAQGEVRRAAEVADVHPKSFERLLRRYGISK